MARLVGDTGCRTILDLEPGTHAVGGELLGEALAALRRCACLELTTRGTEAAGALECVVKAAGAARLVFASGSPLYSLGSALMSVQFAALSDADRAAILGENMARLLEGQR